METRLSGRAAPGEVCGLCPEPSAGWIPSLASPRACAQLPPLGAPTLLVAPPRSQRLPQSPFLPSVRSHPSPLFPLCSRSPRPAPARSPLPRPQARTVRLGPPRAWPARPQRPPPGLRESPAVTPASSTASAHARAVHAERPPPLPLRSLGFPLVPTVPGPRLPSPRPHQPPSGAGPTQPARPGRRGEDREGEGGADGGRGVGGDPGARRTKGRGSGVRRPGRLVSLAPPGVRLQPAFQPLQPPPLSLDSAARPVSRRPSWAGRGGHHQLGISRGAGVSGRAAHPALRRAPRSGPATPPARAGVPPE